VLLAESFISGPAIGNPVQLPFPSDNRDCWIYVDDCAEQLVRLSLKPKLNYLAYNSGGQSIRAGELASLVRFWLPEAKISFDEDAAHTPLVDDLDGSRLRDEIGFTLRPLRDGVLAHINEARQAASLPLLTPTGVT
jgi:nucleoside-diphosphate-sugar epimerase